MINKENLKKVLNFLEFTHRKEIYTYKICCKKECY